MRALRLLLAGLLVAVAAGAASAASPAAERRVVRGSDGYLFIAQDWSVPCQYRGSAAATAARAGAMVDALQADGIDVTVVLGPDKGSLRPGNLPRKVPQRSCGENEKRAVWAALASRLGPDLLDLRRHLADAGARYQVYWRQDTHWTPTGGVVLARRLAAREDYPLARRLQAREVSWTRRGDLADVLGIPGRERVTALQLVNPGVQVTELARGDAGLGMGSRHFVATPTVSTAAVLPGRTLFVGDSFTHTVVTQLAPLYEDVTFLWPDGGTDAAALAARMREFDRVVVQRVERFSSQWRPYDADVVAALRRAAGTPR